MDISFAALLSRDYWFSLPPSFNAQRLLMYGVVLCALLLLGVVFRVASQKAHVPGAVRRQLKAWGALGITSSLIGLVFMFFRYEYIPVLSYRFWFGVWVLGVVIAAACIVYTFRTGAARPVSAGLKADPYLPRPKHKK